MRPHLCYAKWAARQVVAITLLVVRETLEAVASGAVSDHTTHVGVNASNNCTSHYTPYRNPYETIIPTTRADVSKWVLYRSSARCQHPYTVIARLSFSRIASAGWTIFTAPFDELVSLSWTYTRPYAEIARIAYVRIIAPGVTLLTTPFDELISRCAAYALSCMAPRLTLHGSPISLATIVLLNAVDPSPPKTQRSKRNARREPGTSRQTVDRGHTESTNQVPSTSSVPIESSNRRRATVSASKVSPTPSDNDESRTKDGSGWAGSDSNASVHAETSDSDDDFTDDHVDIPDTSTNMAREKATHQRAYNYALRCGVCRFTAKSEEEKAKHYQVTGHDERNPYVVCDFPGCGQSYSLHYADRHLHMHYGEPIVCGLKNPDGSHCKWSTLDKTTMWQHRRRPHDGEFRCEICNWFVKGEQARRGHKGEHNGRPNKRLQHVTTYNGPATALPIRGIGNKCPECPQKLVCMSHFLWHWKQVHTEEKKTKTVCAKTAHPRCELCGYCMPMSFAIMHNKYNCLSTTFPQTCHANQERSSRADGLNMVLCECGKKPDEPRQFDNHLKNLSMGMESERAPGIIDALKSKDLVTRFFEDNVNADQQGGTYAIIQLDTQMNYTFFEFLERIQYIGSSTKISARDLLGYSYIPPMEPDSVESMYRIRLGTSVSGRAVWQFNECDVEILETFVIFYLSLRNLWNREYPQGAQGWLLNDRFRKFAPVFDAIAMVALYGAYEEIVRQRKWDDSRVTHFKPPMQWGPAKGRSTYHAPAPTAAAPLIRMSSQEAYVHLAETLVQTAKRSGKSLQQLIDGTLAYLPTEVTNAEINKEVQPSGDLGTAHADDESRVSQNTVPDPKTGPLTKAECSHTDDPPAKTRKLDTVCTASTSAEDGPQSAKSDDSGIGSVFNFESAVLNEAASPRAHCDARSVPIYSKHGNLVKTIDLQDDPLSLTEESSSD